MCARCLNRLSYYKVRNDFSARALRSAITPYLKKITRSPQGRYFAPERIDSSIFYQEKHPKRNITLIDSLGSSLCSSQVNKYQSETNLNLVNTLFSENSHLH